MSGKGKQFINLKGKHIVGMSDLSEDAVLRILHDFGLSKRESDIYFFLSKSGLQSAQSVSTRLRIERVQTYRVLKSLQEKGIVEATLEVPTRYTVVSFEQLLDSLIRTKKSEIGSLEGERNKIVEYWRSLGTGASESQVARFRFLTDQKRIHEEIARMIEKSKKHVLQLTTTRGILSEDLAGTLDTIQKHVRKSPDVLARTLTNISKDNIEIVEQALKKNKPESNSMEWRHIELTSGAFPQFIVVDDEEAILHVTHETNSSESKQAESGLWIRSEMFVSALKGSFWEMWRDAVPAEMKIVQLKTGKPVEETIVIRDSAEALRKLTTALESAKKDIIVIMSSEALNRLAADTVFANLAGAKARIRVMAPVDLDNFDAAQELSKNVEVRSVSISYLSMLVVDGDELFIFKTPAVNETVTGKAFYLSDLFFTNDSRYVERVNELLEDTWKRGTNLKELIEGPSTGSFGIKVSGTEKMSKIIDLMLENNMTSVVVAEDDFPVGIITQRDLLSKILKLRKDPSKTRAKDVMSVPLLNLETDETLTGAMKRVRETGIKRLAIAKNGQLVGILKLK